MSLYRSLLTVLGTLVITAAFVPAFAFAQSYNCANGFNSNNNWSFWNNGNSTLCTPGQLLVYVQVTNNFNNGYNLYNQSPSNFTVAVGPQCQSFDLPGLAQRHASNRERFVLRYGAPA